MRRPVQLVAALAFFVLLAQVTVAAVPDPAAEPISLENFLFQAGNRFDCYFTIEQSDSEKSLLGTGAVIRAAWRQENTLDGLLAKMRADLGVEITRDEKNSAVIHLVEPSIAADNPMDKKVDLKFSGSDQGLMGALNQMTAGSVEAYVNHVNGGDRPLIPNTRTHLDFDEKGLTIRAVLSSFLPLDQYNRVLWISEASLTGAKHKTTIWMNGPMPWMRIGVLGRTTPWTWNNGIVAYALADNNSGNRAKAVEALEGADGAQIRWAMLWLGKNQVVDSIPALIKHIEYQYTDSGVIAENLPAVAALGAMQEKSRQPLLNALKAETNEARIRLLAVALLLSSTDDLDLLDLAPLNSEPKIALVKELSNEMKSGALATANVKPDPNAPQPSDALKGIKPPQ